MRTERTFVALALLLNASAAFAQQAPLSSKPSAEPSRDLTIDRSTPTAPTRWGLDAVFDGALDRLRPDPYGRPKWILDGRVRRQLGRLQVAAGMSLARGERLPASVSRELGTGRDLSVDAPLTGPGSYGTAFDLMVGLSVGLKQAGRLRIRGVGELWNPFPTDGPSGLAADRGALRMPAFKFGIVTAF